MMSCNHANQKLKEKVAQKAFCCHYCEKTLTSLDFEILVTFDTLYLFTSHFFPSQQISVKLWDLQDECLLPIIPDFQDDMTLVG